MSKTVIATDEAPAAIGPYSQGVRVGNLIFTAGQVALDPATQQVVASGITEQTTRVLENLKAILEAAGSSLAQVVKATVFLKDLNDFAAMNEVYGEYLGAARRCAAGPHHRRGLPPAQGCSGGDRSDRGGLKQVSGSLAVARHSIHGTQVPEAPMSEAPEKIVRTEAEWRAQLTPEQYRILREKATERPFTGALTAEPRDRQLPLRRLRSASVPERGQVRLRLRLAQLHAARRVQRH